MHSSPSIAVDVSIEDKIADIVLAKFNELPAKSKPTINSDGNSSWVPLSGIVLRKGKYGPGYLCCYIDIAKRTLLSR